MRDISFSEFAQRVGDFQKTVDEKAVDGVCHLYKNGEEQYTVQIPESACKYNCDQLNKDDPSDGWTYVWNPIG